MVPNQTIPSGRFICQYNTSEGNPNNPRYAKEIIDTLSRYLAPRLHLAMQSQTTTRRNEIIKQNANAAVYPNPSDGQFTVVSSSPFTGLKIRDMTGRTIGTYRLQKELFQFNVAHLPDGLYILTVEFSEGFQYKRIAVAR